MSAHALLNLSRMLDSIYHMTLRLLCNLSQKRYNFVICKQLCNVRHNCKSLVVYRFYCMALFHSQTRPHMINMCL